MALKFISATRRGLEGQIVSLGEFNYQLRLQALIRGARKRAVNNLLEFIVLTILRNQDVCGYEIIGAIHTRFKVLLSPGSIYPVLDAMASTGLIAKERVQRKILLSLTPLGESMLKIWQFEQEDFQCSLRNMLPDSSPSRRVETETRQNQ